MKTFNFGDTKVYLHKDDLPDSVEFTKEVAVDSETTGLSLVRDRLCLLQIATSKNECHLIKFEKIDNQKKISAKNLINLFENENPKHKYLMKTIDYIQKKEGQSKIRLASQDLKKRWKMKQEKLSASYTCKINEIINI